MPEWDVDAFATRIRAGNRRALAKAITLIESSRAADRAHAVALVDALMPDTGHAARVGISGPPGVGKSTFIEALGLMLTTREQRVAVLAIDPSSTRSGGSILGDKTRMEGLGRNPLAFIRPSPSRGALGGVARRTREAMLLCEASGFDAVLVETVGVGQSETEVDSMVDTFVLLLSPGGGDELQGVKRGVMELADIVVITKADGELEGSAKQAASDYRHAVHLLPAKHRGWETPVILTSAAKDIGIADVWACVRAHREFLTESGVMPRRRADQAQAWMWRQVSEEVLRRFRGRPDLKELAHRLEAEVADGTVSPMSAADDLLRAWEQPDQGR